MPNPYSLGEDSDMTKDERKLWVKVFAQTLKERGTDVADASRTARAAVVAFRASMKQLAKEDL